ncbi:hypothetical protein Tco_0344590 [Tanacetum coccineum]
MKTIYAKKSLGEFGMVIHNLINLGFTSMTEDAYEDAYASTIFLLLKQYFTINTPHQHTELGYKLNDLGGTMAKVNDLAGDEYKNSVLESIKEWIQSILLMKNSIIMDYPDSVPAIDDLKQCLEYTGKHSKLVDSFISSLWYRDSLLEELNRNEENRENTGLDDDINTDDKQVWIDIQWWEPDPIKADPLKGSRYRRKVDVLGMIVSIIDSSSGGDSNDHLYTLVDSMVDGGKTTVNSEEMMAPKDQWHLLKINNERK